jgi:hypothetical protein
MTGSNKRGRPDEIGDLGEERKRFRPPSRNLQGRMSVRLAGTRLEMDTGTNGVCVNGRRRGMTPRISSTTKRNIAQITKH